MFFLCPSWCVTASPICHRIASQFDTSEGTSALCYQDSQSQDGSEHQVRGDDNHLYVALQVLNKYYC